MKNITDIAKIAGVSKSTVSRYLNNGSVSNKTKQKLDKIIEENDYQPNQFARSLRAQSTNMIGAIIPRMNSHAVDETIKGVKKVCDNLNYRLLLNYTNLHSELEIDALETFNRSKVDGVIFMATEITDKHLEVINKMNVPVVIIGQEHPQLNCVIHDDYQAGYMVGKLIGQKSYKKVKYFGVTETDIAVGVKRKNGLCDGLKAFEIEPVISETSFHYKEALKDVSSDLENARDYDVIIGATDSIALAVHKFTFDYEDKLQQPLIVGFGGDPVTEIVTPAINTVEYHFVEAGEIAMSKLQRSIKNQQKDDISVVDVTCAFKL
ncbi:MULTISPECIES: LacI family DNA-binding transcriptional regulator [Staphylococcus]|uniref:LacI family DNA-binding transcriptional regulator n=1 Tax=Staphylococcus hsinchuensis TaxID=3051183 RepID=A0ABZ3EDL3_9STAP|nr:MULTISPECIES: LacI family DNA-binding transcriptional regulator [unclassified Staphylococcus]